MKISKFKLIDGGRGGIEIEAQEYQKAGHFKIVDSVKRKRKILLSDELIDQVKKLKYYFLNLTGHWIPPYTQYYDAEFKKIHPLSAESSKTHLFLKELWNKVEITGAKAGENGFLITGKIETIEGKFMGITTPFVTDEDDFGFYNEAMEVLTAIGEGIENYFNVSAIPVESGSKQLSLELKAGKTNEEIAAIVEKNLMDKGAIIMMADSLPIEENMNDTVIHQSTSSIDSINLKEMEEENEKEKEIIEETKSTATEEAEEDRDGRKTEEDNTEDKEIISGDVQGDGINTPLNTTVTKIDPFGPPASEGQFPIDTSGDIPVPKEPNVEPVIQDVSGLEHSENMGPDNLPEEDDAEEW